MSYYIPMEMPGGIVWVEVNETIQDEQIILTSSTTEKAVKSFQECVNALKDNAQYIFQILDELSPKEIEIAFGIKLGAEAGTPFFGLAKASGEAHYTVTMKWSDSSNHE